MDENHRTVISNTISTVIPQRLRHHKLHVALCLVTTILMIAVLAFFPAKTPVQWMACVIACCCPLGIAFVKEVLAEADKARRLKSPLTPAQHAYLEAYGYPYVGDAFRFHMTLTGSLPAEHSDGRGHGPTGGDHVVEYDHIPPCHRHLLGSHGDLGAGEAGLLQKVAVRAQSPGGGPGHVHGPLVRGYDHGIMQAHACNTLC